MPETTNTPETAAALGRLLSVTRSAYERSSQLQHALASRVVIEQAKGILAERYGLGIDEAFEVMRRAARSHRMRLHDLASDVVRTRETPAPVADVLRARR